MILLILRIGRVLWIYYRKTVYHITVYSNDNIWYVHYVHSRRSVREGASINTVILAIVCSCSHENSSPKNPVRGHKTGRLQWLLTADCSLLTAVVISNGVGIVSGSFSSTLSFHAPPFLLVYSVVHAIWYYVSYVFYMRYIFSTVYTCVLKCVRSTRTLLSNGS